MNEQELRAELETGIHLYRVNDRKFKADRGRVGGCLPPNGTEPIVGTDHHAACRDVRWPAAGSSGHEDKIVPSGAWRWPHAC